MLMVPMMLVIISKSGNTLEDLVLSSIQEVSVCKLLQLPENNAGWLLLKKTYDIKLRATAAISTTCLCFAVFILKCFYITKDNNDSTLVVRIIIFLQKYIN